MPTRDVKLALLQIFWGKKRWNLFTQTNSPFFFLLLCLFIYNIK